MQTQRLRALIPQPARERLYAWHPGRERRWRLCPGLERVRSPRQAVLSFDDGPDPDATPAVLDALERAGARATFFMVGSQVQRHPALAREVHARGHDVALHCQEHRRLDRLAAGAASDDLRRGFTVLQEATGVACRWYRPPFGRMTPAALDTSLELGMSLVYWSAWGMDWEQLPAARIAQLAAADLRPGAIVLLHDSARYGRRPSAAPTADAIPLIAVSAVQRGIALTSLDRVRSVAPLAGAPAR